MSKNILITGASRGIGYDLALCFLKAGNRVFGTNRSGEFNQPLDANIDTFKLDLAEHKDIESLRNQFENRNLKIDILINNAGIGPDLDTTEPDLDSFKKTFDVNVTGTTFLTEALLPFISVPGKIINISSKMGSINRCELQDSVAYRMSKTALNMYSKILTNRFDGRISVASIHPGWVRTNISQNSATNGRLSAQDSSERIYDFVVKDYRSGIFWDVETQTEIEW